MILSRRDTLILALGAAAVAAIPLPALSAVEAAVTDFTGGAPVGEGGLTLTVPELAENGNAVPVSAEAPGAAAIMILAAGNPYPGVCKASFGPAAGSHGFATRMRLAGTQEVIALARLADGSFVRAARQVQVTVGGCAD